MQRPTQAALSTVFYLVVFVLAFIWATVSHGIGYALGMLAIVTGVVVFFTLAEYLIRRFGR